MAPEDELADDLNPDDDLDQDDETCPECGGDGTSWDGLGTCGMCFGDGFC